MTCFEIELADGSRRKLTARQPCRYKFDQSADVAAEELQLLNALHSAGLPVPQPIYLDCSSAEHPEPFFVMEFVEGAPEFDPTEPSEFVRQIAEQLAHIHRVDYSDMDRGFLPLQTRGFGEVTRDPNDRLRESEIRQALQRRPIRNPNKLVLRHGDFWPGNILWRDGDIVAVIDWEEALVGEPLADHAITRLDVLWVLGVEAMEQLTEHYLSVMDVDTTDLPYWDLCASLRPISNIGEWAPAYADLGRPDITAATMTRDHKLFVDLALGKLLTS